MPQIRRVVLLTTWIVTGVLSLCVLSHAGTLPKIVYVDPYWSLASAVGMTIEHRNSYYGQIDSCGADIVVGIADSNTTNNNFSLKYIGEDDAAPGWKTSAGDNLRYQKAAGFYAVLEAEPVTDSLSGYGFLHATGNRSQIDSTASRYYSWQCVAGRDLAGMAIDGLSPGSVMQTFKYTSWWAVRFRLRVGNNATSDTVCILRLKWWQPEDSATNRPALWLYDSLFLKGTDFTAPNQWQDFGRWLWPVYGWYSPEFRLEWTGATDLDIDKMTICNDYGSHAMEVVPAETLQQKLADFYQRINPSQHRNLLFHEPTPGQFAVLRSWQDAADQVAPYHRGVGVGNDYLPYFFHNISVNEQQPFMYQFGVGRDSATTSASTSVQFAYDTIVLGFHARALECKRWNIPMVPYIQTVGNTNCLTGIPEGLRDPTVNEIIAQGMLVMAYGARGIGYFLYPSLLCDSNAVFDSTIDERLPRAAGYMGANRRTGFRGIVDWSFQLRRYIPNYKYWAVKSLNAHLDSLWRVMEGLTWTDAGPGYTARTMTGSFIDSVTSLRFTGNPYAEVGLFNDAGGNKFFMLVNRRSLSSDSQRVRIYMPLTSAALLVDQYSYDSLLVGSCGGPYSVDVALKPGEGKLFRVVPLGWTTPDLALRNNSAGSAYGDGYGWAVSSVGDVDADGTPDYAVGAPWAKPNGVDSAGAVYVYSGKTGQLLRLIPGLHTGGKLGWSICDLGDVNGGGDEFVLGEPGWNRVGVFTGGSASALHYWYGEDAADRLGWSVAGIGDWNHDGTPDFIAGAPGHHSSGGLPSAGCIYVLSGNGTSIHSAIGATTPAANDQYGYSVAAADVNGDGTKEFVVGAPYSDHPVYGVDAGAVYVGSWIRSGFHPGDRFGWSVACTGVLPGFSSEEIIIGAPFTRSDGGADSAGAAYVYFVLSSALMEDPSAPYIYKKSGVSVGDKLGWSVTGVGDVNADCVPDFSVGAPGVTVLDRVNAGATYIYSGNDGSQITRAEGEASGDGLGSSVAAAARPFGLSAAYVISGMPTADRGGNTGAGAATVLGMAASCDCPWQGDLNADGMIDLFDVLAVLGIASSGDPDVTDPSCPTSRADVNNDSGADIFDVIYLIGYVFSGGPGAINPCAP